MCVPDLDNSSLAKMQRYLWHADYPPVIRGLTTRKTGHDGSNGFPPVKRGRTACRAMLLQPKTLLFTTDRRGD